MRPADKVAVEVRPQFLKNQKMDNFYAARIKELGLTAYGSSRDEAHARLRRMLGEYIEAHRSRGTLKERLDRSGLKWSPLAAYDGGLPVVDVSHGATPNPTQEIGDEPSWRSLEDLEAVAA